MAKKPTITTVAAGYQSTTTVNSNFTNVRDAFDNTLSLDGSTPNAMQADFDMNQNDILNANSITTDSLILDGVDMGVVQDVKLNIADITTVANSIADVNLVADNISGINNVSDAINNGDLINDVYQGAHSADPTVRLNSNPLQNGDIYFNTNTTRLRTYSNGSWYDTGAGGNTDAALVSYLQTGTGAVARTTQARLRDVVNIKDFGAVGDGVTNDAPAVQACLTYCAANNKTAYVPSGTYLLNAEIYVPGITNLGLVGDGSSVTIFKRGDNVVASSFTEMFNFVNATSVSANIVVRGITLDGNARGNQIPVNITMVSGTFVPGEAIVGKDCVIGTVASGQLKFTRYYSELVAGSTITGATSGAVATVNATVSEYLWQQSHCLRLGGAGVRMFNRVLFDDIYITDPTADGLGIGGNSSNTYGTLMFMNVVAENRNRVRSDITITGSYDALEISNCDTFTIEIELNSYNTAQSHSTTISNSVSTNLDLATELTDDTVGWPSLNVTNVHVNGGYFYVYGFSSRFANCNFFLNTSFPTRILRGRHVFNGCRFYAGSSFVSANTDVGMLYEASDGTGARYLAFIDCDFDADPAASFTYYYTNINIWGSGTSGPYTDPFLFRDCTFRRSTRKAALLRSGQFAFEGCIFETASAAIIQPTLNGVGITNKLWIRNSIATDPSGYIYQPPATYSPGNPTTIWMSGNSSATLGQIVDFTRYDKIAAPHGSAVAPNDVLNFKQIDRNFESDAVPTTGKWVRGQVVWNSAAAPSGKVGWVVTTSGNIGTAVFKPFGAIDA